METGFCLAALEAAFRFGQPEIWNSDQGSQFTSPEFSGAAEEARHLDQHGWTGPCPGQRFHRAPVAQSEVRTYLSFLSLYSFVGNKRYHYESCDRGESVAWILAGEE